MKKILIFGASGFIGGCLARAALVSGWEVIAVSHHNPVSLSGADWQVCDITDADQVMRLVRFTRPNAVANLAARANIDRAEIEKDLTYKVNAVGAANIASACASHQIRLVHFTTDAVFDGTLPQIFETDLPNPLNYYGYTKAIGDSEVEKRCPAAVIFRVSLAIGYPVAGGNSFLAMLKMRMQEGVEVFAPEDEIRTPVDIHTLCDAALEAAQKTLSGLVNIGATQSIDRYTLTLRLAQRLGYDGSLVRRGGRPLPGRALRHKNGTLNVSKALQSFKTPMRNLAETIDRAVL